MPSWPRRLAVQIRKTTLSPAQILDLHNNQVELVPAPGAGLIILPISVFAWLRFNTTAYANGADLIIGIAIPAFGFSWTQINQALLQVAEPTLQLGPASAFSARTSATANLSGQPVYIFNPGAAFINGDGALDIYLTYEIWIL